jgi:hypothetical protein
VPRHRLHFRTGAELLLVDRCRLDHVNDRCRGFPLPFTDSPAGAQAEYRKRCDDSERNSIHQAILSPSLNGGCRTEVAPNGAGAIVQRRHTCRNSFIGADDRRSLGFDPTMRPVPTCCPTIPDGRRRRISCSASPRRRALGSASRAAGRTDSCQRRNRPAGSPSPASHAGRVG